MGMLAQLVAVGPPVDPVDPRRDRPALAVDDLEVIRREPDDLAVLQEGDARRVRRDGRRVAREQVLPVAQSDHERAAEPRADDLIRPARAHDGEPVGPFEHRQRALDGGEEIARAGQFAGDQMRHDLRVGLAPERDAIGLERAPEPGVVLDDAVVHHGDGRRPLAADVGMGVRVRGGTMRRPAGVADPARPARGSEPSASSSAATRPARLRRAIFAPSIVARPALSYPRYSSRRSPASRIGLASWPPVYPTMPHIRGPPVGSAIADRPSARLSFKDGPQ